RYIGIEYDFITDQRLNKSITFVAGQNWNIDILPPVAIVPSGWPSFTTIRNSKKTLVTNKILFKSGILEEVHTYDGKARVITRNEVYDSETGRPLVVSVNNEFEDKIY